MIRRPPRSTPKPSSAASDVYKRQIYNHDLEILVKNPRAFDSFLLALAGQNVLLKKNRELPDWTMPEETKFIIPDFGI